MSVPVAQIYPQGKSFSESDERYHCALNIFLTNYIHHVASYSLQLGKWIQSNMIFP